MSDYEAEDQTNYLTFLSRFFHLDWYAYHHSSYHLSSIGHPEQVQKLLAIIVEPLYSL